MYIIKIKGVPFMSEENKDEEFEKDTKEEKTSNESAPATDIEATRKIIFSLCYLWGILFFLPLILYKNDSEAQRHANEGLVLFIAAVIGNAVFGILTRISSIFGIIAGVFSLLLLLLGIIGIVYVVTDQKKSLPVIGAIKIIK